MTLETYLRRSTASACDHVLRARIHRDGRLTIFLHPLYTDGRSLDLQVNGNTVSPDPQQEFAAFDRQHEAQTLIDEFGDTGVLLSTNDMDILESHAEALLRASDT